VKVVLDTNVVVSGLLNPHGAPGGIVRMIGTPGITLCVDARILAEYEEVIRRPRFQIEPSLADSFVECVRQAAELHTAGPLKHHLPDRDDEPFLAVALAAQAEYLVTGNLKHFPPSHRQGVKVVAPMDFMAMVGASR